MKTFFIILFIFNAFALDDLEANRQVEDEELAICTVCFENVIDGSELESIELLCHHKFHMDCLVPWFQESAEMKCPICKFPHFVNGSILDAIRDRLPANFIPHRFIVPVAQPRRPHRVVQAIGMVLIGSLGGFIGHVIGSDIASSPAVNVIPEVLQGIGGGIGGLIGMAIGTGTPRCIGLN